MSRDVSLLQLSDIRFFEEYKRLDNLCSDMYSCQNGVSEYIAQMEQKSSQGRYRISSWDSDYKMLKHVRWVRNQIAHSSSNCQMSEATDLKSVQDYYDRILSGSDSLTLLRKALQRESELRSQQKRSQADHVKPQNAASSTAPANKKPRVGIGILVFSGILALILLLTLLTLSLLLK